MFRSETMAWAGVELEGSVSAVAFEAKLDLEFTFF